MFINIAHATSEVGAKPINQVNFRISRRVSRGRMDMKAAEIASPLAIKVGTSVDKISLASEDNQTATSNF